MGEFNAGTVTMSLSDVDNMRNAIKDKDLKITTIETELNDIRADRRVMKIYENSYHGDPTFSVDTDRLRNYFRHSDGMHEFGNYNRDGEFVKSCLRFPYHKDLSPRIEFINFDDVKGEIRKELELRNSIELADLRHRVNTTNETLAYREEEFNSKVAKIEQDNKAKYAKLEQAYLDVRDDRKRITREEELTKKVKELQITLIEEMSKPWWKKLFR